MACPVNDESLAQLKCFIDVCDKNPAIINHPKLAFFKTFIKKLGGTVPPLASSYNTQDESSAKQSKFEPTQSESDGEASDLELDMTGVIEGDNDEPQPMGDSSLEPTEEQIAKSFSIRSEAVSAFVNKDYEKAIKLYTEAILLSPQDSLLYAKRGQAYLLLQKPNACIRDCDQALKLNPDSAAAHKFRGRGYMLLGKFEEAATNLRIACKIDFDEQADTWLREVTPNAQKIEENKRRKERKKLERERQAEIQRAREAQAKARENSAKQQQQQSTPSQPGPPPGAAGAGGGPGMAQFAQFLNDPEILAAFQDPEIAEAFKDISSNPGNLFKYQSNPKVMTLISKVASKFGGPAGMAGMMGGLGGMMGGLGNMMGGFGGPGGPAPGAPRPPPATEPDDFGLD